MSRQVMEAPVPGVDALPAGHGMAGIDTFVQFIAGKHVQVSAFQMDSSGKKLLEIAPHIIQGLGCAEIILGSACPTRQGKKGAVCAHGSIVRVIVIPVLVRHPEHIAQFLHSIRKLLQALPSAGLFAGGQIVRVLIVVSGLPPSVQVEVELVHTHLFQPLYPFRPVGERNQFIVFLRIFLIIIGGSRGYMALALHMHDAAADKLFHIGILSGFFSQGAGTAFLVGYFAVELAEGDIIAACGHEAVGGGTGIAHFAHRGQMAQGHPGRASCGMVYGISAVPTLSHIAQIAALGRNLSPPGHVGGLGTHLSVEGKLLSHHLGPVCGQELSLHGVQHRIRTGLVCYKRGGPADLFHGRAAFFRSFFL